MAGGSRRGRLRGLEVLLGEVIEQAKFGQVQPTQKGHIKMTQSLSDLASQLSTAEVRRLGGDVSALPEAFQTVVVIETAQGIIDNGGLEYFFEADFPGNPPYSFFVEVFRRIGAESVAGCIEQVARMFPFAEPHLHQDKRQRWLDTVKDDEMGEFVQLSRRACGDESVFRDLANYVEEHRGAFEAKLGAS